MALLGLLSNRLFFVFIVSSVRQSITSASPPGQGRQEEAHPAHLQRAANLRPGENLRADQVSGRSGAGEAGVRPGDDRVASEGKVLRTCITS